MGYGRQEKLDDAMIYKACVETSALVLAMAHAVTMQDVLGYRASNGGRTIF